MKPTVHILRIGEDGALRIPREFLEAIGLYPGDEALIKVTSKRIIISARKKVKGAKRGRKSTD